MQGFRKGYGELLLVVILAWTVASIKADSFEDDPFFSDNDDDLTLRRLHSDEDSHHDHLAAAGAMGAGGKASSWDSQQNGGMQGGRYAAHNESCGPNRPSCIPDSKMECSTTDGAGRCLCVAGYVYVRETESCWEIPRGNQDPCGHDIQCHSGKWKSISRCSKHSMKCECYDYRTSGKRETIQVNGECFLLKAHGDLCNTNDECDKPMGGAYCKPEGHQGADGRYYNGSCQCHDSHTWHNPSKKCLRLATGLNDDCVISQQCMRGTLGNYSLCDSNTGKCKCHDVGNLENPRPTVFYGKLKKCFIKREYNDTCSEVEQCRASLGPDVQCGRTDDYPDEDICHCPKGRVCRSSGFSTILTASSHYIMAIAATVIGMKISMNGGMKGW